MTKISTISLLSTSVAIAAIMSASQAYAQQRTFNLPSEDAVKAIPEFARQAGVQIVAPAAQLKGVRTTAIKGQIELHAALTQLLAGTPLELAAEQGGVITLRAKRDAQPTADLTNQVFAVSEVVVTGASDRTRKFTAPFAVSTIGSQKIADEAPRSVADLLRQTPGLTVEASGGEGGGENVIIRGLPWSGWRLIDFLQDGMPLFESNTERQMNVDELYRIDFDTQRAEVVRGGTASIYSNNASGGVVNFITRHGSETPEGAIRVETGTGDRVRTDAYWAGPLLAGVTGTVSGTWRTDDGLRNPGFTADKGGQLKAGLEWKFDHGNLWADVKYLDDRSIFYTDIPLTDPRTGPTFGQSLNGLINQNYGTLDSAAMEHVQIRTLDAQGNGAVINRDLSDGVHPRVFTATLGGTYRFGDGFTVSDTYRHTSGTVGFDGLFNGASPSDATAYLSSQLSRAQAGFNGVASLRYVYAGTNNVYNPATTDGLVMVNNWNSTRTQFDYDADDIRLRKAVETPLGVQDLTFGLYFSRYHYAQTQDLNAMLMDVKNNADVLDVQALNSAGQVVGSVTENGFVSYGSGSQSGSLDGTAFSYYGADTWKITPKWTVDVGGRIEVRSQAGYQGVLGTVNLAPTGPLADRNVQGVVSRAHHAENLVGRSYTLGTAYDFSSSLNVFARYGRSFSYPRFDTILGAATLPGSTTPLPVTTIYQAETGVKYAGHNVQLFAVGFWSKFDKLNGGTQVADANGNITNSNIIFNTTTTGVELEGGWTPIRHVELNASAILQDPVIDSVNTLTGLSAASAVNKAITRTPKYQATLEPAYTFDVGPVAGRVFTSIYAIGKRYQDFSNLSVLPAYATADIGLTLKAPGGLEGRLLVENLTNAAGLTEGNARASVLGSGAVGDATVGRPIFGRTFTLSLTKRW